MMADVAPILAPDAALMRQHLEFLFGGFLHGYQDGLIELAWTTDVPDPETGRYDLGFGECYETDDDSIDALVARAVELNSRPRTNVYVGAALRKPGTRRVGRTSDSDFYAAPAAWTDLDDQEANEKASDRFGEAPPSFVVRTGAYPFKRHQIWYRFDEPVTSPERIRGMCTGLAHKLGGDPSVCNPGRVMRLAGGIAWDQKKDRRPEPTRVITLRTPGLAAYMPEHVERVFPPLYTLQHAREQRAAPGANLGIVRGRNGLGLETDKVIDGREKHMTNVLCARLIDYCGSFGAVPTPEDLFEHAWDAYERTTDLDIRPGRGKAEFAEKCRSTMRRFETGKIRGIETLEKAVDAHRMRRTARRESVRHEAEHGQPDADDEFTSAAKPSRYLFETVADLRKLPPTAWLVKRWIPAGGFGIFYGKWAAGKSFIGFDLGLHLSYGMTDWHGEELPEGGCDVLVLAREGHAGFVGRVDAFKRHYGVADDTDRLKFMRAAVSFMRDDEFAALCEAVRATGIKFSLIIVDTVARVLPGVDMNEQQTVTLFTERCAILGEITGASVIGVHHENKNGGMMGSAYFEANADFVFEISRLGGEDDPLREGEILCTKMKDGEDRWRRAVTYQRVGLSDIDPEPASLVVSAIKATGEGGAPAKSKWPEKDVCRQILAAADEAWRKGGPAVWSDSPNTGARYAARIMGVKWRIGAGIARQMVDTWLINGVLSVEERDAKLHIRGLKVTGSID